MITFPNAKLNLGLNVVSKRTDGYHDLETVFAPLYIHDALEITPSDDDESHLFVSGLEIDGDQEKNLVMKALRLIERECGIVARLNVHLEKQIPFQAGIGGGSADASFMLMMLCGYFQLDVPQSKLIEMAAKLGADCPFFILNRPVYATGIGEVMQPLDFSLDGITVVLVKPDVCVSTKEAFSGIRPMQPKQCCRDIVMHMPIEEWRGVLENDFERSIFPLYPEIEQIKQKLYDCGAAYAAMSGSGSSVFGLFRGEPNVSQDMFGGKIYIVKG